MSVYQLYELNHAAVAPLRAVADVTRLAFRNHLNPLSDTPIGRSITAAAELFERTTRRYGKPAFGLHETVLEGSNGAPVPVQERVVWQRPFCSLLHFQRELPEDRAPDPKVLIVAPMSGHYATLLRGTVAAMLPAHEVFITDWQDARMVPLSEGRFDLDDYIDYLIGMLHHLGEGAHVIAVCQPSVPVLAAVALMEEDGDPLAPATMTLMGGPIDTRKGATEVDNLAEEKGTEWFRRNVIMPVPFPHPGFLRPVYPGFLQLSGFMSMNLDRHLTAHREFFSHLVQGDGEPAEKHREFYDEYLAVMDLTAEFYLQTVETVFVRHALPEGEMAHRGRPVRPAAIRNTALLTVEGERDDISGVGQTEAAHALCTGLPAEKKAHHLQEKVGHYGVFNGSRFRAEIQPRIAAFMRANSRGAASHANGAARPLAGAARTASERLADGFGLTALRPGNLPALAMDPHGEAADLTQIAGVGPKLVRDLNRLGIFQVRQLAEMTGDAVRALDEQLRGRPSREDWFGQARRLSA